MEDLIISPSSSSSLASLPQGNPPTLQQKLQFLLQSQPNWWVYAIFWQAINDGNDNLFLTFGEGHFQGTKDTSPKTLPNMNSSTPQHHYPISAELHSERKKFMKGIQSLINDNPNIPLDNMCTNGDLNDAEWFYVMSLSRTFSIGNASSSSLPGKSFALGSVLWLNSKQELQFYNCERSKEAHMHGIETLICIPTTNGVIEMGSYDVIKQNWGLVQHIKSVFGTASAHDLMDMPHDKNLNTIQIFDDQNISFADIGIIAGVPEAEEEEEEEEEEKRKKEDLELKKSDFSGLKFGSSLQSSYVDSEHSDSDCPMLATPNTSSEKREPKKRGRKPGIGRETPMNHVEAERQRREKLNHRFYALRAVVPNVSRMDKASLLSDAVAYINQLKAKIDELEMQQQRETSKKVKMEMADTMDNQSTTTISTVVDQTGPNGLAVEVDVKIIGPDAMVRVQSENVNHPGARLMGALRDLEFQVHHASMSCVNELLLQDVVVKIPMGMRSEEVLKSAILRRLDQ